MVNGVKLCRDVQVKYNNPIATSKTGFMIFSFFRDVLQQTKAASRRWYYLGKILLVSGQTAHHMWKSRNTWNWMPK